MLRTLPQMTIGSPSVLDNPDSKRQSDLLLRGTYQPTLFPTVSSQNIWLRVLHSVR